MSFRHSAWVVLLLGAFQASRAEATPVIYNTGVDALGNVLPDNSPDPHYTGAGPSTIYVGSSSLSATPPADTVSNWIRPATNFGPGSYLVETTFAWPTAQQITITGQWAAYAGGSDIVLNGVSNNGNLGEPGFTAWHPFSITGNAVAGTNMLDFRTFEDPANFGTNVGLRVEIASVAATPEPASAAIGCIAASGLISRRRRGSQKF